MSKNQLYFRIAVLVAAVTVVALLPQTKALALDLFGLSIQTK